MNRLFASVCVYLIAAPLLLAAENQRPNFVVVLVDDLGFSDIGCYGGEIETPNLDSLANGGLRYTQFHNCARCTPTRASLLTGYFAQQVRLDDFPDARKRKGPRQSWARLLPEYLRDRSYRAYHSGKWHLDGTANQGGFDHSYSLNDHDRNFSPQLHTLDNQPLPPVQPNSGYYTTTAIAQHGINFLKEHAVHDGDKPFFLYLTFTVPHFPLHAPAEDVAKYKDRYRQGWDKIRAARWKAIQKKLQIPGELSDIERKIGPPYFYDGTEEALGPSEVWREMPWDELTVEQKEFQVAKMAVHAAMVDRLDQEVGRVISQLREMNAFDDTVIFFLSDNGASAELMVRGDGHDRSAPVGSAESFVCLGPGWSNASNTPFRRHKSWVHEGGTATPLIVHWPHGISARGELRTQAVGHVIDLAPTMLELAGGKWNDDPPAPRHPGCSLTKTFHDDAGIERPMLWWLHEGNRAIRVGNWKLVAARDEPWELFDLTTDRAENHNLAESRREKVKELEAYWSNVAQQFVADRQEGNLAK